MRVAVTGGSGQLGTVVLRRLIDERSVRGIVSLDLRPPAAGAPKLTAVRADIRDPDLARHLAGCDALVHLAFVVTRHLPRPIVDAINVEGSKNVFRAAAAAGLRKIVYTSSVAAYGVVPGHPVPIVETTPRVFQPGFAYAATKFQVEAFLDAFEREHPEIAVVRFRPGIFFGAGMDHAIGRALQRGILADLGSGPLPVVWNGDVAEAIVLALKQDVRGAFNLTARQPLTSRELADAGGLRLLSLSRRNRRILARVMALLGRLRLVEPVDPAWADADAPMVASSERALGELGWRPRCPTAADVIRRFVDTVPRRTDRRIRFFLRLAGLAMGRTARSEGRGIRLKMHLALFGPGGGDWTVELDDGRARLRRGVPRPPDATVTLSAATFLDLLAGRLDVGKAELVGKIHLQGEPIAGMVLAGMVRNFRAQVGEPGWRGSPARVLAGWMFREAG
jgi:UDP-glucose 4-epimerase